MSARTDAARKYFTCQRNTDAEGVVSIFADDSELYNVSRQRYLGKDGVRTFCTGLYAHTSKRDFEVLEVVEGENAVMVEWRADMTFPAGADVRQGQLADSFDIELRGINKFEFSPGSDLVRCLRIYHDASALARLAEAHVKAS